MKTVTRYEPPAPADLEALKRALQRTGRGMAELAGVADGNQWRKYTGGEKPRQVTLQMLFYMAARLELDPAQVERVFARMQAIGATLDLDETATK